MLALPAEFGGAAACDGLPLALPEDRLALPAEFDAEDAAVEPEVDGADALVATGAPEVSPDVAG